MPRIREMTVFTTTTRLAIFCRVIETPSCWTGKIHNGTPGKWCSFPL
jgi:hypothetical protein